ncbi:MAG: hypothetical protein QOJ29_1855 [Thermoleophilaceae bacterium]|jgi:hypothetical protein|nr:hypothetical protein [Thermoleophilaceae bacterium]
MATRAQDPYRTLLKRLDEATRRLAADVGPREEEQKRRDESIVALSKLGVPRAVVGKLTGLTRARVQQILDRMDESGATGDAWQRDQALRRMVEYAILERPVPSFGIGIRRESVAGPYLGAGWGRQIRLTDDVEHNRSEVVWALEKLIEHTRAGDYDELLTLTQEEDDIVRGRPLASE